MTEFVTARWRALGTTASVVVCDARAATPARAAVEAELDAIDVSCSRFREDSGLSALNRTAGRPTPVSALLLEAIVVAQRAAQLTDGAFDPTIGEALIVAGYDRDFAAGLNEPGARVSVRRAAGWRALRVDQERRLVTVPRGTRLDLGATAKALAADRAAAAASEASGGCGVLVNLGGDIAISGPPPPAGWAVRVTDDHRAPDGAPGQSLSVLSGGVATSSTTARRWGRDSHHIIDPRTGRPARSRWRTVSVAADSCVDANIASTAAIVLGDDAPAWLDARNMPARLVDQDGAVHAVAGWPAEQVAA